MVVRERPNVHARPCESAREVLYRAKRELLDLGFTTQRDRSLDVDDCKVGTAERWSYARKRIGMRTDFSCEERIATEEQRPVEGRRLSCRGWLRCLRRRGSRYHDGKQGRCCKGRWEQRGGRRSHQRTSSDVVSTSIPPRRRWVTTTVTRFGCACVMTSLAISAASASAKTARSRKPQR